MEIILLNNLWEYIQLSLEKNFKLKDSNIYQKSINQNKGPKFTNVAEGRANIETYTVMFNREGPLFSIIYGRLENGTRFIANTPNDKDLLYDMTKSEYLNKEGFVNNRNSKNIFKPI